jgi:aminopeptidase N
MNQIRFVARVFVLVFFILNAVGLAQTAGSSSLNDPFYPWMGNGGYDALDYDINLKINYNYRKVSGLTTMTAVTTQDLSSFNLDFGSMEVKAVTVNGKPARFEHNDPELLIVPDQAILKNKKFKVNVVFAGSPGSRVNANTIGYTWNTIGSDGLSVLSQPSMTMAWTPVNDYPADKATFSLRITAPKDQTVVANGRLISKLENPDQTATSTYRIATPTTTYMLVFAVGDFQYDDAGIVNGVHYRNYFSYSTSDMFKGIIAKAPKIMKYLTDRLGAYPFDEFGVLTTNTFGGGGLETQTLVTLEPKYYNSDYSEDAVGEEETLAHEMTHQWFGASVTYQNHAQTFLHEGFAEYFGLTYINDTQNPKYLSEQFQRAYKYVVNGLWTYKSTKAEILELLQETYGNLDFTVVTASSILDALFGSSLSVVERQRILDQIKNKPTLAGFITALEKLLFTRVYFTRKTWLELTGGYASDGALYIRSRVTPPGKLEADDYVLNAGVYFRGAMTLHALKLKTGDDLFYKILRTFLERYKFSNAFNQDFVNVVKELAGEKAKTLLESWLYDDHVPDFPEMGLYAKDFQLGADFK